MVFSSSIFIFAFLPFVLFVYYVIFRSRLLRNVFLFISSLFFYAWGEPSFVFVMLLSIMVNYAFGLSVEHYHHTPKIGKLLMVLMVAFNLSIMFIFKYLMFTIHNINLLTGTGLTVPNIALPIGISFFTFQAMSYVIDVYRKDGKAQKNPLNLGLYIAFFPQLVAGPIIRYQTIENQIYHRKENFQDFSQGICRFIQGLGKKILLANTLALVADKAFALEATGGELSVCFAWLGAIAYTLQIFFDFSGYSDMAIGLGRMFGFHFNENFNYPYISKSATEFWRRWHISLGSWFRDYVFIPLGGSRVKTKNRLILNLFIVWFLTGLWHGANWTFICWGLFYFVLLTLEKTTKFIEKIPPRLTFLTHIYAILAIVFGWVLFRSDNITQAISYFGLMFGLDGNPFYNDYTTLFLAENRYFLLFGILFSLPIKKWFSAMWKKQVESKLRERCNEKTMKVYTTALQYILGILSTFGYIALFLVSISYTVKGTYNPFIYFNF